MFCPPKNQEPFDINKDLFIISGREAFSKSHLLAVSRVLDLPKNGRIGLDQFFLSIPTVTLLPGHIDIVKETFAKYKIAKEPSKYVEHGKAAPGQEYLFVTFADNFHKALPEETFVEWDKDKVEAARQRFIAELDKALIDYYYRELTF
jgi:hypothetical protein